MTVFRFEDDLVTKERSGEKIRIHLDSTEVIIRSRSRGRRRKTSYNVNLQLDAIFEALPEFLDGADDEARSEARIYAPTPKPNGFSDLHVPTSQDRNHIFPPLFVYLKNFSEVWIITDEKLYVCGIWSIFKHISGLI